MKNWKTTLSGIGSAIASLLAMVAIAPYQLGDLGAVIPPEYKSKVAVAGLAAAFALRVWNAFSAKDATVPAELDSRILEK